ncbi:hypothetical protein [uncultured Amphritea sp.]|mgnify:CR=1 FL=1|uniref:hypothetical protein n=1 Tax=uncultured Amphritea sp. TaxID=981605 RepID=UPI0026047D40|nr:hypothetical protein [uncultured Amphritea sp.]
MKLNNSRIVNSTAVLFSVVFLTACTSQPLHRSGEVSSSPEVGFENVLPADVNEILAGNQQDLSLLISSGSLQGKNLTAGATYFAASGRFCRKVVISDDLSKERFVACTDPESTRWELISVAI